MEKTVTIKIGGSVFHIEDEAYEILKSYLDRIKNFYRSNGDDYQEIVSDIEDRIAELLHENSSTGQITHSDKIRQIIETIGEPEDFESTQNEDKESFKNESESSSSKQSSYYQPRNLFRNTFDKKIGGVCSGIAAYTDIDVTTIRLITALLILFGGLSFWAYVILWILIPRAYSWEQVKAMKKKSNSSFINRIRNRYESIRIQIDNLKHIPQNKKKQAKDDLINKIAHFTLNIAAPLLFLFILFIKISGSFPHIHTNIHNYGIFNWNHNSFFTVPITGIVQVVTWMLTIVTITCIVLCFVYSKHKTKLSRDPYNKVFAGVCGGIGRSFDIDPVVIRLVYLSFIVMSPFALVSYLILWIIFPNNVYLFTENNNVNDNEEEEIIEADPYIKPTPSKGPDVVKGLLIFFVVVIGLSILIPSIVLLIALLGKFTLIPTILSVAGAMNIVPAGVDIAHIISSSSLIGGKLGIFGIVVLPILFIAICIIALFRKKKIRFVALILLFVGVMWFVSVGTFIKSTKQELKNYEESAMVLQEEEITMAADTVRLTLSDEPNPYARSRNDKFWFHWSSKGGNDKQNNLEYSIPTLAIEQGRSENIHLLYSKTGRGRTASEARQAGSGVEYEVQKQNNEIHFDPQFGLSDTTDFRAQTLDVMLKIPVGKTIYIDPSLKNYLNDIQNLQNVWDEDMVDKYWLMTEEGLSLSE